MGASGRANLAQDDGRVVGAVRRSCSNPLYQSAKKVLFRSKVIGTDDTGVKVLDPKLNFARTGRIWPYLGDAHHPVVVLDYTPTRGRDGPAKFLEGYKGYLQADAYASTMHFSNPPGD